MEYFKREILKDIVIEKINLSQVTFIETKVFWERLQQSIYSGYTHFIIDLKNCLVVDQTFVNMISNIYQMLCKKNGTLRLVLNPLSSDDQYKNSGLAGCIGINDSVETTLNQITMSGTELSSASARKF